MSLVTLGVQATSDAAAAPGFQELGRFIGAFIVAYVLYRIIKARRER